MLTQCTKNRSGKIYHAWSGEHYLAISEIMRKISIQIGIGGELATACWMSCSFRSGFDLRWAAIKSDWTLKQHGWQQIYELCNWVSRAIAASRDWKLSRFDFHFEHLNCKELIQSAAESCTDCIIYPWYLLIALVTYFTYSPEYIRKVKEFNKY